MKAQLLHRPLSAVRRSPSYWPALQLCIGPLGVTGSAALAMVPAMPSPSSLDAYTLDPRAVQRAFDRASRTYADAAVVQGEIRSRLLERLDLVRLQPAAILDLGAASGQSSRALARRYAKAKVVALDLSTHMLRESKRQQPLFGGFLRVRGDAQRLPLRKAAIDLAFSNLMLAWCNDPDAVFAEIARTLRTDGLFTFTTLGPDTLKEVRAAFREVDAHTHVHRFIDMHDLGDALLRAGFSEPVMDTERLTVTYPSIQALMRELRATGAVNATLGRRHGLIGRECLQSVERALASDERGVAVTIEVVYGHAWHAEPRAGSRSGNEFVFSADALKKSISNR